MASLTDLAEARLLAFALSEAPAAPVLPLMVALLTAAGTDAAPGTEVVGGTYTRQQLSVTRTDGQAETDAVLRFEGIPADLGSPDTVIAGVEIWDSDSPATRWWHGTLAEPKTVVDGVLEISAGDLTLAMD